MSKKQGNLRNWLGIKEEKKEEIIKHKYFYIKWSNEFLPDCVYWCKKKPDLVNYETIITWKSINEKIYIIGYFEENSSSNFNNKETKYKNIAYIKSLLQKAIRRGNINVAIKSAFHFIKMDLLGFLRRILIIMIEDVIIHESFNVILWFMIVLSKDNSFKFKKYIIKYLLGVVYIITNINKKKVFKDNEKIDNDKFDVKSILKIDNENLDIIYSLCLRREYGGLKCDMLLIEKYVKDIIENGIQEKYYKIIVKPIELIMENLYLEEWIIEAIDFHCEGKIVEYINKKYGYSKKLIEKIIWSNNSKINYRIKQNKLYQKEFNIIKNDLKKLQIYLLQNNY
jgi:hypothetical protein